MSGHRPGGAGTAARAVVLGLALLHPLVQAAEAQPDAPGATPRHWTVEAGTGRADYTAEERQQDGQRLNRENGRLNGARVAVSAAAGAWSVRLAMAQHRGTVGYLGRSQFGFPLVTLSRIGLDAWTLDTARAVWPRDADATSGLWLQAALGERRIDRNILPGLLNTELTERLRTRLAQFGAEARFTLPAGWQAAAAASLEQGFASRLDVDFHGLYDPARLTPERGRPGWAWRLEAAHALGDRWHLRLQADGALQRYGASPWQPNLRDGVAVGQLRYPGSVQRQLQLGASLAFDWR